MFNSYVSLPEGTSTIDKECILYGHDCGIDSQQWHEPSTGVVWKRICFDNGFPLNCGTENDDETKGWQSQKWGIYMEYMIYTSIQQASESWEKMVDILWEILRYLHFPQKKRKAFWDDLDQISRFLNRGYPTNLDLEIWLDFPVNI